MKIFSNSCSAQLQQKGSRTEKHNSTFKTQFNPTNWAKHVSPFFGGGGNCHYFLMYFLPPISNAILPNNTCHQNTMLLVSNWHVALTPPQKKIKLLKSLQNISAKFSRMPQRTRCYTQNSIGTVPPLEHIYITTLQWLLN